MKHVNLVRAMNEPCPNAEQHSEGPSGYIAWHEWAGRLHRTGHRQSRCPGCGLYRIWSPKPEQEAGK